jgi:hypothetical protein
VSPVRYELGFYIPEDGILHSHRREHLKSLNSSVVCASPRLSTKSGPISDPLCFPVSLVAIHNLQNLSDSSARTVSLTHSTNIIYIQKSNANPVTGRGGSCVFPVRYEHHLHINTKATTVNRPWRQVRVFLVRYKHHLHKEK